MSRAAAVPAVLLALGAAAGAGGLPENPDSPAVPVASGAGVFAGGLEVCPEPDGFDGFWGEVRAEAAAADLSAARRLPLATVPGAGPAANAGRGSFAFELPLSGGNSASGFVVMPVARGTGGTFPLVVAFAGYSETNPMPTARHPLWGLPGAIVVHLSTHGFPLGRDGAFYAAEFERISAGGTGGAFGFRDEENDDPRTSYFRRIAVRDLAALRFLETLPEWDRAGLYLLGAHLGAWRATAAAANDAAVRGLAVWNPWLCDLGGAALFGRPAGWAPSWRPALGFFDGVALAKRVNAPCAIVEAPLDAAQNPPAGPALFHAALAGPKSIVWAQGARADAQRLPGAAAVRAGLDRLRTLSAPAENAP